MDSINTFLTNHPVLCYIFASICLGLLITINSKSNKTKN